MANGILDLNTDDNTQQDDNLFLSQPEQRGLEAATFGSVLGQAPATGSFFGDIFSTLAQTAPAAVATFKERQSIKEKEAEYKEKTTKSLAEQIKGQFVYDTLAYNKPLIINGEEVPQEPGANRYVLKTELAQYAGTGRFQPKQTDNSTKNIKKYSVFTKQADGTTKVESPYLTFKEYVELKIRSEMDNSNIDVQPYEEPKNYFDKKLNKVVPMTPTAFLEKSKNEPNRFRIEPDEAFALREEQKSKEQNELIAGRDAVRKEYQSTSELVDIYENISERLMAAKMPGAPAILTGASGDAFIFLESVSAGVSNVFQVMTQDDDYADERYALAEKRVEELIARDKNIDKSLAQFIDTADPGTKPGDRAQTIKSMLTQFVYAVAKSRESGGKFSVSDIDFAFMSAGRSSDPEKILRGMSAVIAPILKSKISKARTVFRDPGSDKILTRDELWKHPDFQSSQNVLRLHYAFEGIERPEEWDEYDERPEYNEEKKAIKEKADSFYEGILKDMELVK
tara:strand:- start:6877 stop:8406 length:1530 start_codon:yes stop_codon:yes gene_type:complete